MSRRFGYVVKYFSVLKGELVAVKKRMPYLSMLVEADKFVARGQGKIGLRLQEQGESSCEDQKLYVGT